MLNIKRRECIPLHAHKTRTDTRIPMAKNMVTEFKKKEVYNQEET